MYSAGCRDENTLPQNEYWQLEYRHRAAKDYYQTRIDKPLPEYTDNDGIRMVIDGMKEYLNYAKDYGITLALENH